MNLEIGNTPAHTPGPDFCVTSVNLYPSERTSHSVRVLQSMNGP